MTCKQEVIELFKTVLIFQEKIQQLKQSLFFQFQVTDTLLWNNIVGQTSIFITPKDIINYIQKNSKRQKGLLKQRVDLFFYEFSLTKDQTMSKKELMFALLPNQCKGLPSILQVRKKNSSYSKTHQPHYRLIDQLIIIFQEIFNFLIVKNKMKKNIYQKKGQDQFNLQKAEVEYLLMFVNEFCPTWTLKQCEKIFNHIFKNKSPSLKQFYYFFVPYNCSSLKFNPNIKVLPKEQIQRLNQTYQTTINHKKISYFGRKTNKYPKVSYLNNTN